MSGGVGIAEPKNFLFGEREDDRLTLDCAKDIGPVNIRYETYGELNADRSNAVLILHALTGDAHVAGRHSPEDSKPGWWDDMVGGGRPFDTDRYFIVCGNVLGGCSGTTGPRSINPATGKRYNMDFPVITINDMVRAQVRLMDYLEIDKWLAIAGGSMGGMQVLEWAVSYPERVGSAIAIATTPRLSPQSIAFDWVGREAIMSDPNWLDGEYDEALPDHGLAIARMLAHITYLSEESMFRKFGRNLQELDTYSYGFERNFQVESYLQHQGRRFVERFDANSYLYITRAMDYYDAAAKTNGDLTKAFASVSCPFLVVSFSSDWLFPSHQSAQMVEALLANDVAVSYCDIESSYGHDAFLLEAEILGRMMKDFIGNRYRELNNG